MFRHMRREEGQELVEYALVLPLVLLILFGIIEMAVIVFSYDTLVNAAREGARYGAIHPNDEAGIEAATRALVTGLDEDALQSQIQVGDETVRVELTYDAPLLTGFLVQALGGSKTLTLKASATMRIE